MKTEIFFYTLVGLMMTNFIVSFRQVYLLRQLFKNKEHKGWDYYKFLWPFWTKTTLITTYGQTIVDTGLINKLIRLRTISILTMIPILMVVIIAIVGIFLTN